MSRRAQAITEPASMATGRGKVAEIRAGLRPSTGREPGVRRRSKLPATGWLLSILVSNLVLNCVQAEWAGLAAIALTALMAGVLVASGSANRAGWVVCALMAAPAAIGGIQWMEGTPADWAAAETRILRALAAGLLCLAAAMVRDAGERDRLMDGLAFVGGLVAILGLIHTSLGYPLGWWPFPNRNHFAACCELLLPIAAWRAWHSRGWQIAPTAALTLGGVLSGSRAGFALIVGQALWLGWWMLKRRRHTPHGRWLIASAMVVPAVALVLGGEAMWTHWRESRPLLYRDQIWTASWELLCQRPGLGHGLGSFPTVYPSVALFDTGHVVHRAHNDWLEWMVEGGVVAALPMLILLALLVPRLGRLPWALGVPTVLTHSLVDYPIDRISLLLIFCLIATLGWMEPAVAHSHRRTHKRLKEKPFPESESFPARTLH